jgi:hypothetical protein
MSSTTKTLFVKRVLDSQKLSIKVLFDALFLALFHALFLRGTSRVFAA